MVIATRYGGNVELRTTLSDLGITGGYSGGATATAGVTVSASSAGGIPAVTAAVRVAAQAVAMLDLGVYRGIGVERTRVTSAGAYPVRLFREQPNAQQDGFGFLETIEESLSYRGNAYIWKAVDPASGRVVEWYALHPDQVLPQIGPTSQRVYQVAAGGGFIDPVGKGFGFYRVGQETILHIRGFGDGGSWIAPSPIMRHRLALGASLAKLTHEAATYEHGAAVKLAVIFPESMNAERAKSWRELWDDTYAGASQAGKTAVIGGGGQIAPIGLSMVDAQFIESQQFSIEEVARIFNVPQSLIGGGHGTKGDHPLTPEHEQQRWLRHGLAPRLHRIEAALRADPSLFAPNGNTYPMFDTSGVVRGDLATEADIALGKVQSGQWLVDEARALDGLPPLPGGAGKIPQVVPVGGGPNPAGTPSPNGSVSPDPGDPEQASHALALQRSAPPVVNLRQEAVTFNVPQPEIHVHVPEQAAPRVSVTTPAPVVNVAAPSVSVTVEPGRRHVTFQRNQMTGQITGAEVDDGG